MKIKKEIVEFISNNNLLIMRDKKTHKGLGISYSEDGLRTIANKNGVYLYCKGRVNNLSDALKAPKSENVIIEKFIPQNFNNEQLNKCEMLWVDSALKKLYN